MSVCIYVARGPASMYPVADPRRTAGSGPYRYGYAFAWDGIEITVSRNPTLTSCQMNVGLVSTLPWNKEIKAWNLFLDGQVNNIGTAPGLKRFMIITKPVRGMACGSGTHTVVLCRAMAFNVMTGLYSFDPDDFWDFWGGYDVTLEWRRDDAGSGVWGAATPPPIYPMVRVPDGTLMAETNGPLPTQFSVAVGGASFLIDDPAAELPLLGLNRSNAVPSRPLPSAPADFTLVRELDRSEVYVVYGGAKFRVLSPWRTSFSLGLNWRGVRLIPRGRTNQLTDMPFDGTLLQEQHDTKVFLAVNGRLSWVTSDLQNRCLSWRHVRIVPDNALSALPRGPDI